MSSCPPYYAPVPSDDLPQEDDSVSTVAATVVGAGQHILRVEGYSRLKTMHGGYLESAAFMAAGHAWRVCCYLICIYLQP
ncbi:BTB/POZ and MATH domain-containing protein 2-like [Hordeum vulgare]|nr:BTB/POZ and MATH domain-containing protein 2-like [Hordeum vulgare]